MVTGGGTPFGRAIALALAARGVRVVVSGSDERALGETVGLIVCGSGKARHLAGNQGDPAHLAAAVERAASVFGAPDLFVVADQAAAENALPALAKRAGPHGRVLLASVLPAPGDALLSLVRELGLALREQQATCNAILLAPSAVEDGAADAAELAVYLCSGAGDRINGQAITVGA